VDGPDLEQQPDQMTPWAATEGATDAGMVTLFAERDRSQALPRSFSERPRDHHRVCIERWRRLDYLASAQDK
jgi:hypothetical protein